MEGVSTHPNVIALLADSLHKVLVHADAGGLERLGRDLLLLVADKVGDKGKEIDRSLLGTNVKDLDLGLGHTTAVARLNVGLILLVAVAAGGTATHLGSF